jgi:endonuclease/exonuclease/phosphatase family metal-dependent hydrolase
VRFPPISSFSKRAPAIAGAVFLSAFVFLSGSCERKSGTSDWDAPRGGVPVVLGETAPLAAIPASEARQVADSGGLRFISYNVKNWLTMDRYVERKSRENSPKPLSERKAVIGLLVRHSPDIVGLCEIGTARDLAEIQESLKSAGLDLPFSRYVGGSDPVRHLGLLSRFPITATAKPEATEFKLKGRTFGINRGILDATVEARGKPYRFIGVHLKSKREVEDVDQEQMRIHEARLLRRHIDSILTKKPDARLVVYGDFNDTRPSKAFKSVTAALRRGAGRGSDGRSDPTGNLASSRCGPRI